MFRSSRLLGSAGYAPASMGVIMLGMENVER
jgi:hypothetical protein